MTIFRVHLFTPVGKLSLIVNGDIKDKYLTLELALLTEKEIVILFQKDLKQVK